MTTYSGSISGSFIVNGSHSWTITDSDLQSLLDWATVTFSTDGTPLANGAALIAWQQWMLNQTRSVVSTFKKKQAVEALTPITPIVFT